MQRENIIKRIKTTEEKYKVNDYKFGKYKASLDNYFQAFSENIMSKWVHTSFNISAIELEINGGYRWFEGKTERQSLELFCLLLNWLKNMELS